MGEYSLSTHKTRPAKTPYNRPNPVAMLIRSNHNDFQFLNLPAHNNRTSTTTSIKKRFFVLIKKFVYKPFFLACFRIVSACIFLIFVSSSSLLRFWRRLSTFMGKLSGV